MEISCNHNLRKQNTFGMDVSCACYVEYGSADELVMFFSEGKQFSLPRPFLHIGKGSNLLFTKDFEGTVFHSGIKFIRPAVPADNIPSISRTETVDVEVGAGTLWDDFCIWCAENSLWGPENLSGIPGETGAAAVQNIGAYGVEIQDIIKEVRCFDAVTCSVKTITRTDCHYGYRDSVFKQSAKGRYIVTSVVFTLSAGTGPRLAYGHLKAAAEKALAASGCKELSPAMIRSVVLGIRDAKLPDPAKTGSAGSFFKNPVVPKIFYDRVEHYAKSKYGQDYEVPHFDAGSGFIKIPAAWLIDQCGWKGYREGNAGVWEKQPLVLVNATGKAAPEEIVALAGRITASVVNLFGIELTPEVEYI